MTREVKTLKWIPEHGSVVLVLLFPYGFFCVSREREGKGLAGIIGCEYGCSLLLWSAVIVASLPCTFWRRAARTFFSFCTATNCSSFSCIPDLIMNSIFTIVP